MGQCSSHRPIPQTVYGKSRSFFFSLSSFLAPEIKSCCFSFNLSRSDVFSLSGFATFGASMSAIRKSFFDLINFLYDAVQFCVHMLVLSPVNFLQTTPCVYHRSYCTGHTAPAPPRSFLNAVPRPNRCPSVRYAGDKSSDNTLLPSLSADLPYKSFPCRKLSHLQNNTRACTAHGISLAVHFVYRHK